MKRVKSLFLILKQILGVRRTTPAYMVYGETGKQPLIVTVHQRMLQFWNRLVSGKTDKLSFQLYRIMLQDYNKDVTKYKWLQTIILNNTGFRYAWLQQTINLQEKLKLNKQ